MKLNDSTDEFMRLSSYDLERCRRSIESMLAWRKLVIDAADFAEEDYTLWKLVRIPKDMPEVVALNIWDVSHSSKIHSYIKIWEGK